MRHSLPALALASITTLAACAPVQSRAPQEASWARQAVQTGQRLPLTQAEAEGAVRRAMRDPEAVRFSAVRVNPSTGAVCGMYNSKNLYGAYIGETPFLYFHSQRYAVPQLLIGRDVAPEIQQFIYAIC